VRFQKPIEVPFDDTHCLLSHSARLKGGSPFAEISVFNGVPIHQDEIYITTSKARTEFAKQVKNKIGIAEGVSEIHSSPGLRARNALTGPISAG
jgi:hypothetical protein